VENFGTICGKLPSLRGKLALSRNTLWKTQGFFPQVFHSSKSLEAPLKQQEPFFFTVSTAPITTNKKIYLEVGSIRSEVCWFFLHQP
jgi:hypothetical protein